MELLYILFLEIVICVIGYFYGITALYLQVKITHTVLKTI